MRTAQPRTAPSARLRLRAVLVLPLLLLLAGCFRLETAFTINADDTADISVEMLDKTGSVTREELDCQTLVAEMDASGLAPSVDYTVEDLDEDGNLGCAFDVTGAPVAEMTSEGLTITEADGVYTFALEGDGSVDPADLESFPGLEVTLDVTFPGAVIDAGGGEVDGRTVTWSDPAVLAEGVTATGEAAVPGGDTTAAAPGDEAAARDDAASADEETGGGADGTSWWWWALGALVLLAVVVGLVIRSSRQGRDGSGTDSAGSPGHDVPGAYGVPGQPGVAAGYGQPAPPTAPGSYGVPGQRVAPGAPGQPTAWAAAGPTGQTDPTEQQDEADGAPDDPDRPGRPPARP